MEINRELYTDLQSWVKKSLRDLFHFKCRKTWLRMTSHLGIDVFWIFKCLLMLWITINDLFFFVCFSLLIDLSNLHFLVQNTLFLV